MTVLIVVLAYCAIGAVLATHAVATAAGISEERPRLLAAWLLTAALWPLALVPDGQHKKPRRPSTVSPKSQRDLRGEGATGRGAGAAWYGS